MPEDFYHGLHLKVFWKSLKSQTSFLFLFFYSRSTLLKNLLFSEFAIRSLRPAQYLSCGVVNLVDGKRAASPMTNSQLNVSVPFHQFSSLAVFKRSLDMRSMSVWMLMQFEILRTPLVIFWATQRFLAVSKTQASLGSTMRNELW